jgi:hypothetical protein
MQVFHTALLRYCNTMSKEQHPFFSTEGRYLGADAWQTNSLGHISQEILCTFAAKTDEREGLIDYVARCRTKAQ